MSSPVVEGCAFARAGILGNPSDVYSGRVITAVLKNFQATVSLEESSRITIQPHDPEEESFRDMAALADAVSRRGYYGGRRLVKALIKVFHDYCQEGSHPLPSRGFRMQYRSSIPRQVGLAGSSAIVTAALRALMSFFEVEIPKAVQPNLVLSAEFDELGITAGLMDRVAQVYEGLVYMDLSQELVEKTGHGSYEVMDPRLLPPMFVAHHPSPTKVSGRLHDPLRVRWEKGDREVRNTLERIAALATEGRGALLAGDHAAFATLMDENFELRRRIMQVSDWDVSLVEAARALGASAKLTGSGGAIIGVVEGGEALGRIRARLSDLGAVVIDPAVA